MIWNAIKFITLSEIAAWIVFIAVTVVLGSFGIRSDAGGVQTVMMICWLVVFAVTKLSTPAALWAGAKEARLALGHAASRC
jgi:hypothetical protein